MTVKRLRRFTSLTMGLVLCGCSTGPSHLPAPWELPGAVVTTTVGNAVYGARRKKVASYLSENINAIASDVRAGYGPHLQTLYDVAKVRSKQGELLSELKRGYGEYFPPQPIPESLERLTVAVMVHSD